MQVANRGRRVGSLGCFLFTVLVCNACGGGGGEGDGDRVAVLDVRESDPTDAVLTAAAKEHGAPGECEPVHYRVRANEPGAARKAAQVLRSHGFDDVEAE